MNAPAKSLGSILSYYSARRPLYGSGLHDINPATVQAMNSVAHIEEILRRAAVALKIIST
jgi:hypothetical protein